MCSHFIQKKTRILFPAIYIISNVHHTACKLGSVHCKRKSVQVWCRKNKVKANEMSSSSHVVLLINWVHIGLYSLANISHKHDNALTERKWTYFVNKLQSVLRYINSAVLASGCYIRISSKFLYLEPPVDLKQMVYISFLF